MSILRVGLSTDSHAGVAKLVLAPCELAALRRQLQMPTLAPAMTHQAMPSWRLLESAESSGRWVSIVCLNREALEGCVSPCCNALVGLTPEPPEALLWKLRGVVQPRPATKTWDGFLDPAPPLKLWNTCSCSHADRPCTIGRSELVQVLAWRSGASPFPHPRCDRSVFWPGIGRPAVCMHRDHRANNGMIASDRRSCRRFPKCCGYADAPPPAHGLMQ